MLCCIERFYDDYLSPAQHHAHTGGVNKAAKVSQFVELAAITFFFLEKTLVFG